MCCEQELCALAVHNEGEGVCYLKESEALSPAYNNPASGLTSYTITTREGRLLRHLPKQTSSGVARSNTGSDPRQKISSTQSAGKVGFSGASFSRIEMSMSMYSRFGLSKRRSSINRLALACRNKVHRSPWSWHRRSAATSEAPLSGSKTQRI